MSEDQQYSIEDLLQLMARLREPETGCPWDLKQSYATIVPSTLEEAYEVADAIESGDFDHLKEELGDLLFQVIFYSQLGQEEERFNFKGIVNNLVAKLIRRHPHVFPEGTLESRIEPGRERDETQIKAKWEALKQEEREEKGKQGTLDDVPVNLPALTRAAKLQKRAAGVGFDWPEITGVLEKVEEEVDEVKQALQAQDQAALTEEIGDLLFAIVNASRHLKIDPEGALRAANRKFERRFRGVEEGLQRRGMTPAEASLTVMDNLWDEVKKREKQ